MSLSAGLIALGACARDPESTLGKGDHTATERQELVSAAEHYVGAGSCGAKQLALTFDDGPGVRTSELSTYLKEQGIRAVFFVNGACIHSTSLPNNACGSPTTNAPQILAQLTADGHLVANHTTTHRDITTIPEGQRVQELAETDALITQYAKTPYNRRLFRAPFGSWSSAVASALQSSAMAGYIGPVYWDAGGFSDQYPNAAADWACFQGALKNTNGTLVHSAAGDPAPDGYATTKECGDAYLNEIGSVGRGIVLMHDQYGWAQGHTVDMVKYLVPILKSAGYTFVRADEVPVIAADLPACSAAGCTACSGPGPSQCTSCVAGRYLSDGACVPCSTCDADKFVATACSATADTVCGTCDATCLACTGPGAKACTGCAQGRFLSEGVCGECRTCPAGTYATAACTSTKDTVCAPCHAGCKECTGPGEGDCVACPAGQFASGGACHTCTTCAPGTVVAKACSAATDTVCTPADSGRDRAFLAAAVAETPSSSLAGVDPATPRGEPPAGSGSGSCALAAPGAPAGLGEAWVALLAVARLVRRRTSERGRRS